MATREPIQVLRKAAAVLEQLANEGELPLARLAELTSEPKTTVHRLLASLESLGLVERGSARGSFRIGLKLLELGSSVLERFDERQAARPWLQRLHDTTEQTVFLCIRADDRAVCIDRVDGRWVRSMVLQVGGSLPLHVGAAPRVLLAFDEPGGWKSYVERVELRGLVPSARIEPEEFLRGLEQIRERGYAVADGDTAIGMAGIGAPVFDFAGKVRASISLSGPSGALLGAALPATAEAVVATAAEISRSLGFRETPTSLDTGRHLAWLRPAAAARSTD